MPNHVQQKLTICGLKSDVEAFVATARGASPLAGKEPSRGWNESDAEKLYVKALCFHMIAPLPDDFCRKPYGSGESYGYNAEADQWSVKWGPYDCCDAPEISNDGTQATYTFTCAWGAPTRALTRASLRYRCLLFVLSYGGEGPCRGREAFKGGEVIHEIDDDYRSVIEPEETAFFRSKGVDPHDEDRYEAHGAEVVDVVTNKRLNTHADFVAEQVALATAVPENE